MINCHICGEKIRQTESRGVEIDEETGEEKPYHFHCLFPDDPTICEECGQKIKVKNTDNEPT